MRTIKQSSVKNKGIARLVESARRAEKTELAAQWRALQRLGAMPNKTRARAADISPQRAAAIRKAYTAFQDHAIYKEGYVIRPLERHVTRAGRASYRLGGLFQALPGKPRAPAGSIRTRTKTIVAKNPGTALKIERGKVIAYKKISARKTLRIEEQPLIGSDDYLKLLRDIENGTFKIAKNENIRIYSNGSQTHTKIFGAHELDKLAAMLRAYMSGDIKDFDSWADQSALVTFRVITKNPTVYRGKSLASRSAAPKPKPKPKPKPRTRTRTARGKRRP